jgi:hypothetical protein
VTPDEARKLLGGYATGSLTEAERRILFEAALHDQELFEELASEQVLKEVLDEPGARQRLVAALEPPRHRALLWGWAGAAATAATLAIVVGIMVFNRTPQPQPAPQQIAQAVKPTASEIAAVAPPVRQQPAVRKGSPPTPSAEAPAELKKEERLADQLQQVQPQSAAEAPRGFVAGRRATALRSENATVSAVNTFAFNYSVGADGFLQIVPAAPGFLSVTANDAVVFPSGAVGAEMPVRIQIPAGAASLTIGFSGAGGVAGSPVRRDGTSGTVTDQDPPNRRILIQLFLTPATR